jgi:hypothetical protein
VNAVPGRLTRPIVDEVRKRKMFGIRAGLRPHRFLGLWAVAVGDRVFVRTWNDKPTGWFRAFAKDRRGMFQLPLGREIPIRVRRAGGERLLDAIDAAYAEKYNTPGSMKFVRGFATARRRVKTLELLRR